MLLEIFQLEYNMPRKSAAKKAAQLAGARNGQAEHEPKSVTRSKSESESESETSSDEDEDDVGDLLTNNVEANIQKVLETIRNEPDKLLDKETKFFDEGDFNTVQQKKEKAMYLKDYHRRELLDKMNKKGDEEEPLREVYQEQQEAERKKLVAEIHSNNKGSSDEAPSDDDEDGFLTKRTQEREIEPLPASLPDPSSNEEAFLDAFVNSRAWVAPAGGESSRQKKNKLNEEDSDEDIELADQFETAYNHRFEEPGAAEIVSYARTQNTIRRKEQSSRKRQREKKSEAERESKSEHEKKLAKAKNKKVNEIFQKFESQLGGMDEDVAQLLNAQDLEGDFDADEWDKRMAAVFDDKFYDNINVGDDTGVQEDEGEGEGDKDQEEMSNNKKRKLEKERLKNEKKRLKELAEQFVQKNMDLVVDEVMEDTPQEMKFRYREVSPESFGLTARDILLADDKQLNQYVSMKKLASFRDDSRKEADRRRYAKSKRLREWRKEVFKDENGPQDTEIVESLNARPAPSSTKVSKKQKKKR